MTVVYFIRHAQADRSVRDGLTRPLTKKGIKDSLVVTEYLKDKNIEKVISSPYRRALDTVADFANKNGLNIEIIQDFHERKSDSDWKRDKDYWLFIEHLWNDFSYTLSDGESLREVQERNIQALSGVLDRNAGMNIIIGTHGTALSTILNYYDNSFGFKAYKNIANLTPWIVKMIFDGLKCISIEKINVV
jgi:2,3-bisphosphoglycerate-dependent phosphoglycerate mutase